MHNIQLHLGLSNGPAHASATHLPVSFSWFDSSHARSSESAILAQFDQSAALGLNARPGYADTAFPTHGSMARGARLSRWLEVPSVWICRALRTGRQHTWLDVRKCVSGIDVARFQFDLLSEHFIGPQEKEEGSNEELYQSRGTGNAQV